MQKLALPETMYVVIFGALFYTRMLLDAKNKSSLTLFQFLFQIVSVLPEGPCVVRCVVVRDAVMWWAMSKEDCGYLPVI